MKGILIGGKLYLSYGQLKSIFSINTIKCWNCNKIKEGKETYFGYDQIPIPSKLKLPPKAELFQAVINCQKEKEKQNAFFKKSKILNEARTRLNDCIERGYIQYIPLYNKKIVSNVKNDKCINYAKRHAVAQIFKDLSNEGIKPGQLFEIYTTLDENIATYKSYVKFTVALKNWCNNPIDMLHGNTGKGRKFRVINYHEAKFIETLWAHPNQLSFTTVHLELVEYYNLNGLSNCPGRSTIRKYLSQPEIKNRLLFTRNKKKWKRDNKPIIRFEKAPYANNLWQIDATPLQIFCWNKDRTAKIRLELTAIIDVSSGLILGYHISEKEDMLSWFKALEQAVNTAGALPYEFKYDNHGLTKTAEFIELKDKMIKAGCIFEATKPKSPTEKSDIERWFATFQNIYQRKINGFIGEGITSRNQNARIDPEHYSKYNYTYEQMKNIIAKLVKRYNDDKRDKEKSPHQKYSESEKPNQILIHPFSIALLFWKYKLVKVRNAEILITVQKQSYSYRIPTAEIAMKLNNLSC